MIFAFLQKIGNGKVNKINYNEFLIENAALGVAYVAHSSYETIVHTEIACTEPKDSSDPFVLRKRDAIDLLKLSKYSQISLRYFLYYFKS